ncbi:MAG: gliding motility-associated C-terminal domain-containing protein [Bacteroidetes bacterium]|nr:gliding motility-associated C-terminal domain-containing protein [Bacteroidota bacterium]
MKNKLHIEELFKSKLYNHEADVNPAAWNNISNSLQKTNGSSSPKWIQSKYLILSTTVIAISTLSTIYFDANRSKRNNNNTSHSLTISEKQLVKQTIISTSAETENPVLKNNTTSSSLKNNSIPKTTNNITTAEQTEYPKTNTDVVYSDANSSKQVDVYSISSDKKEQQNPLSKIEETETINTSSQTVQETAKQKPASNHNFVIPNVFTPNNDGNNDLFKLNFDNKIPTTIHVTIFNSNMSKVVEWKTLDGSWNGNDMQGNMSPKGVYYYTIQVSFEDGEATTKSGNILLSR